MELVWTRNGDGLGMRMVWGIPRPTWLELRLSASTMDCRTSLSLRENWCWSESNTVSSPRRFSTMRWRCGVRRGCEKVWGECEVRRCGVRRGCEKVWGEEGM